MSLLTIGRYADGWFAPEFAVSAWPDSSGWTTGILRLRFQVAHHASPSALRMVAPGVHRLIRLTPGTTVAVAIPVRRHGPWSAVFRTTRLGVLPDTRAVSARGDVPTFVRSATLKTGAPTADRTVR
jgi:hypothetical protein